MSRYSNRVAIVGVGVQSALGNDPGVLHARLCAGASGVRGLSLFDGRGQRSVQVAEIGALDPGALAESPEYRSFSRCDTMGVHAAVASLRAIGGSAGGARVGVAVGATTGGMYEAESVLSSVRSVGASRESIERLLAYPLSTTAVHIAEAVGGASRVATVCSACSSGATAIVLGGAWLNEGVVDCSIVGGVDGLSVLTLTGFNSLGATATGICRPFDQERAGLVLGEGAGFLCMMREQDAAAKGYKVLAWLSGWAVGAEAHHITHPNPAGTVPCSLMRRAMEVAGIAASDVDFVNAHGTGTRANDSMEARAIADALGEDAGRVLISSSKSQIGHTLAAAGAIEAVITVESIRRGSIPPTGGLRTPDKDCPGQHVIGGPASRSVRAALSNSFGFGGAGCVLTFQNEDAARSVGTRLQDDLVVSGIAAVVADRLLVGEELLTVLEAVGRSSRIVFDPLTMLDATRTRRFDLVTAVTTLGVSAALEQANADPARLGLACGSAFGSVERSVQFLERVHLRGPRFANPAEFPHLVPSAAAGNASLYCGLRGPVATLADLDVSSEAAWAFAITCIAGHVAHGMVAGGAEVADPYVAQLLAPLHGASGGPRGEGGAWAVIEPRCAVDERRQGYLARISGHGQFFGCSGLANQVPRASVSPKDQAVVFTRATEVRAREEFFGDWAEARRFSIAEELGYHEALGGLALAAGAALVAAKVAREVLVISLGRQQSYWFLFVGAEGKER